MKRLSSGFRALMRVFGLWNPDSSLHSAAYRGSTDGVLVALDRGADVNSVDSQGCTPLDHALFLATSPRGPGAGNTQVAQVLIEAGGEFSERGRGIFERRVVFMLPQ